MTETEWDASLDAELLDAWNGYVDRLRALGNEVLRPTAPRTPVDRAEGFRYLARLVGMGIETAFCADALAPMMRRSLGTNAKMYGDNPDTLYSGCALAEDGEYRVSGTLGTCQMVVFAIMRSPASHGQGQTMFVGQIYGHELDLASDGSFELWITPERRDGNWLQLESGSARLIVRQAAGDWTKEEVGRFVIERLDTVATRPNPFGPADLVAALQTAAGSPSMVPMWANEADTVRERANTFYLDAHEHQKQYGGVPGGEAVLSYFVLEPNEALVIEVTPPECLYWNLQIGNYWYESFDYRHHLSAVNGRQAVAEDDGTVRIVVAHEDPGVPNWLDTAGHREGHLALRWVEATSLPVPSTEVVDLAAWQGSLVPSARRFDPADRPAQITAHRLAVDRRFVP
jgi:hypothetical protein